MQRKSQFVERVLSRAVSSAFAIALIASLSTFTVDAQTAQYNEAPELVEQVAAGELAPIEERLPTNPLVVEPLEQIGNYGGTIQRALTNPSAHNSFTTVARASLVEWGLGEIEPVPGLAKSWDVSADGAVYTFHLREGARWSDGHPFTADDLVFWYEAIASNEELTPSFPSWLMTNGEPVQVVKVDDYTVEFRFAAPHGLLLKYLAFNGRFIIKPKHYLSQFHPDYASPEELQAKMDAEGFDEWYQLFGSKGSLWTDIDAPTMGAWKISQVLEGSVTRAIAERNPYYWKVDTEGNQLPYIDRITYDLLEQEALLLRATSGGIDLQYVYIGFQNMPLLLNGAEQENYRVLRWQQSAPWIAMYMNQSHQDPVMRELMQNIDFRAALSHAIDREAMNQLLFLGLGGYQHPNAVPQDPYFVEGYGNRFTEYDPDLTNQLLDEVGLDQRDNEGFRLRPDGERLELTISTFPYETGVNAIDAYELVKQYWETVGVRTTIDLMESTLWAQRVLAGEQDIAGYTVAGLLWDIDPLWYVPTAANTYWAPLYGIWYDTGGESGVEPPPTFRRLQQLYDEMKVTVDEEERLALGREILGMHDENVWMIGTVTTPFQPFIVNGDLVNVLEDGIADYRLLHEGQTWYEQVSYTNPEDH